VRVFLTGGTGFIGRNLIENLTQDIEITAPTSRELDLTDQYAVEQFVKANDFDVILHTATLNATANTPKDRNVVLEKNLLMFFNLARLRDHVGKLIYYGSGAEYDMRYYQPFMKEEYFDTHVPVDPYGFSKYIMAKYLEAAEKIVDLRVFGCFGPYEDWEIRFISNAFCKALHGLPITLRRNVFFDYIWVHDLVLMTEWAMKVSTRFRHYNACTGQHIDLLTLAQMIKDVTGTDVPIIVGQNGLKAEYSGDNSRIIQEMGGFKFTPLGSALKQLNEYYQKRLDSIDRNLLLSDKY